MVNPDKSTFNPGGIQDRIDNRDYPWSEVGFGTAPFDWSIGFDIEKELSDKLVIPNFKIPIKDQGASFSCGGQAWSYQAEILEALATGTFEERSAKYTYSQTYVPGGGSYGRDNANIFVNQGVARETKLLSYENGKAPSELFMEQSGDITPETRADAGLSKAFSYAQTGVDNKLNIDDVAQAIQANHGIILGISGCNNGTWRLAHPTPPTDKYKLWRHWVYAGKAKMISGKKHIGFCNSWGNIGDHGWQWISEDYFNTLLSTGYAVWSGWTHIFNATPVPPAFHHIFNMDIVYGQSGDEVKQLQQALQIEGQFPLTVPITGYYGTVTQDAVRKFQLKYKLASSGPGFGRCGPLTRAKLNELFGN